MARPAGTGDPAHRYSLEAIWRCARVMERRTVGYGDEGEKPRGVCDAVLQDVRMPRRRGACPRREALFVGWVEPAKPIGPW
ncbi:hypothetical protein PCLA_01r0959 [Pseudomonas citronellolis]|nr:hypothetical protein PCLA_01r0959 [Pseudomonas citronellolis]